MILFILPKVSVFILQDMETNRKKLVQEKSIAAEGSSSRCSSHSVQDSSSSSIVGGGKNIN